MKNKINPMIAEMKGRVNELKALHRDEIAAMSPSESREVNTGDRIFTITTWVDHSEGQTRVVVQCYEKKGQIMGQVCAEGFRIDSSGKTTELGKGEIYEFL